MKSFISLAVGATLLAAAAPASAESVVVGGNAAAICTLPGTWATRTSIGGAVGTFSGTTWTIPTTSFSQSTGQPNITSELALRITGQGFCNTLHTIRISSANGALKNTSMSTAPSGFSITRQVKYDAHWANDLLTGTTRRVGPGIVDWIPTGAGQFREATWTAANGVPGDLFFDLRLSIRRVDGAADTPLVAGNYSDTVTVTLSPSS